MINAVAHAVDHSVAHSVAHAVAHAAAHAVAHAVAHAEVLGLCLREQLVTHAAHFKFQFPVKLGTRHAQNLS